MNLRDKITAGLKEAMKSQDKGRLATLRLINAALKDRDIALRTEGRADGLNNEDVLAILAKMVKQGQESARAYEEGGRLDLAEQELAEIAVIEDFLPKQLTEEEVAAAIDGAIKSVDAASIRDMGKVMGVLKSQYLGRMDFGSVGPQVKARLG